MFGTTSKKEIKVCQCDKKTPLLWTFKFPGAEYWCPRCGYTSGMFGAGVNINSTPSREKIKKEWEEKTKAYLSGQVDEWEYVG